MEVTKIFRVLWKTVLIIMVPCIQYSNSTPFRDEVLEWFEHEGVPGLRGGEHSVWNYENTSAWTELYPKCGGENQSPINIQPKEAKVKQLPKFTFRNYGTTKRVKALNNGHTVVFSLPADLPAKEVPTISGGGFLDDYKLVQFHFHWGKNSIRGSEHTIRSRAFAAELHFVHFNSKYETFANATFYGDGLAVLAILIKIGMRENPYFAPVVDQLYLLRENGDETTLSSPITLQGLLPSITGTFYRYSGSLSTPSCDEIVTWTVFDKPISVSEDQIAEFRQLLDGNGERISHNFRSPFPLLNRTLLRRS